MHFVQTIGKLYMDNGQRKLDEYLDLYVANVMKFFKTQEILKMIEKKAQSPPILFFNEQEVYAHSDLILNPLYWTDIKLTVVYPSLQANASDKIIQDL